MLPINYINKFVDSPDTVYGILLQELPWVHADPTVPRKEYYHHKLNLPYTYGSGEYARTYQSQDLHPLIQEMLDKLKLTLNVEFDVIFVNLYEHQHHFLGWHADDSPEMDDDYPIVTVSLGAERDIWFRVNNSKDVDKVRLEHGSACVMLPGMQDTHQHRIPKHDRPCGPRISLTFRVYKDATNS